MADSAKYAPSERGGSDRIQYVAKSLGFIPIDNPVRIKCTALMQSKKFENFIIGLILANSVVLAMTDYSNVDADGVPSSEGSWRNQVVEITEFPFTILFTAECVVKIIVMGFVSSKNSYLRDSWNRLDFVVVVSSLIAIFPGMPNISALRTLRVLRPLRSLSVIPGMRKIVSSLLEALPALFNVVVLQIFVFFIFGILGIQVYSGHLHARCRLTPFPIKLPINSNMTYEWPVSETYEALAVANPDNYRCLNVSNFDRETDGPWSKSSSPWATAQPCYWPVDPDDAALCSLSGSGVKGCGSKRYCGSNYDAAGNSRFENSQVMKSPLFVQDLNWGFTSFDNIAAAFLTIFQSITMEGWTDIMYMCQDANNPVIAALFFILLIVFGSFFLLNLTLAVICDEFCIDDEDEDEEVGGLPAIEEESSSIIVKGPVPQLYDLVTNKWFTGFIISIIVLNTVVLAMDHHPMPESLSDNLEMINFTLSCMFFIEMILKLLGLGFKQYTQDRFNVFDMFIVLVSIFETIFVPPSFIQESDNDSGGALSALRTFRLFRIFKLARNWVSLRVLLATIVHTLGSIVNFGVLLLLFIYIYSLVGIQFFANTFHFDEHGDVVPLGHPGYDTAYIPRHHFDDLLWAFVTIFQVLTGENWNTVMYDGWRAGGSVTTIYFLSLVIFGNFIVMNLFLAILLGNFEGNEDIAKPLPAKSVQGSSKVMLNANGKIVPKPPKGTSMFLFKRNNPARVFCFKLMTHPRFDNFILMLIIISSVALALDNPLYDETSDLVIGLQMFDAVLTILFTVEMIIKVIALGFIANSGSYMRNSWNILDFIIVMSSLLMLIFQGNPAFKALRSLRALRTFRPLRMISRRPGLKLVVNALFVSIPSVINVAFVSVLFFMIFAIVGVNYFKGTFMSCQGPVFDAFSNEQVAFLTQPVPWNNMTSIEQAWFTDTSCMTTYPSNMNPTSRFVCDCWGAEWDKAIDQNFDNIGTAMLTLFEIATTEGWVDVMYQAVDKTDIDMQPVRDTNVYWVLFFVLFMVVGAFFVMNLFVGVIIDNFNRMKAQMGSTAFLTVEQQMWVKTQHATNRISPIRLMKVPKHPTRLKIYMFVTAPRFDIFIMGCIILNTFLMSAQYFGISVLMKDGLTAMNFILALIFTVEAILKIAAFGEMYFFDPWNKFDFSIVVGTAAGIILEEATGASMGAVAMVVRTFRICRVVRLIRNAKGLQQILMTLYVALPGLSNITSLLFLMLFIFAVMGVQLFSKVAMVNAVTSHANFQDFFTAVLFLLRAATGENWNGVMHSIAAQTPGCVDDPPYNASMCGFNDFEGCIPINGCGNPSIYMFMLAFTLLVTYVMLNLSIAVILEGFSDSSSDEKPLLDPKLLDAFRTVWAKKDPKATGYLTTSDFIVCLMRLDPPLGVKGRSVGKREMNKVIADMNLTLYGPNMVNFSDALRAVTRRYVISQNPAFDDESLNQPEAQIDVPRGRRRRSVYNVDTYLAAVRVQRMMKRWIVRKKAKNIAESSDVDKKTKTTGRKASNKVHAM